MSPGLIVLIAITTAVCIVILAAVLYKLARTVAGRASNLAPTLSRPGRFNWRARGGEQARSSVEEPRVRPPRVEQARGAGDERASLAREPSAVPAEEQLLPPRDKRKLVTREQPPVPDPEGARPALPATLVAPDVHTGRSIDVKFRQSKSDAGERGGGEEAKQDGGRDASGDGADVYRHVGDQVTAVLTAAEQAAADLREAALREAERIQRDADEKAAAVLAEAQARRAEADSHSEESRAAADAYVEETRRKADERAVRRVAAAQEQADRLRVEAEERSRVLEAEAVRRREELAKNLKSMEARIESMRSMFRGAASELDQLLPAERQTGPEETEHPEGHRLDDALQPASSHAG